MTDDEVAMVIGALVATWSHIPMTESEHRSYKEGLGGAQIDADSALMAIDELSGTLRRPTIAEVLGHAPRQAEPIWPSDRNRAAKVAGIAECRAALAATRTR